SRRAGRGVRALGVRARPGTRMSTARLLDTAWAALSEEAELPPLVQVSGEDAGLLPSCLPCTSAMVAAVAASGLAVSALTAARTGNRPLPVSVDAEHVA